MSLRTSLPAERHRPRSERGASLQLHVHGGDVIRRVDLALIGVEVERRVLAHRHFGDGVA